MPKFPESALAHRYLDGLSGIEIGGSAHNDFNIKGKCIFVDYTDDLETIYKKEEMKLCGEKRQVDVVAYAHDLPFEDESLDYVLSSHVLEHVFDTIGCIKEWLRVLKKDGLIYCVFPHKMRTFDKDRKRTLYQELINRHSGKIEREGDVDQHFTVWITEDAVEFIELLKRLGLPIKLIDYIDVDDKVGNGFTIICRKT